MLGIRSQTTPCGDPHSDRRRFLIFAGIVHRAVWADGILVERDSAGRSESTLPVEVVSLDEKGPPLPPEGGTIVTDAGLMVRFANGREFSFAAYIEFRVDGPTGCRGNHYHVEKTDAAHQEEQARRCRSRRRAGGLSRRIESGPAGGVPGSVGEPRWSVRVPTGSPGNIGVGPVVEE